MSQVGPLLDLVRAKSEQAREGFHTRILPRIPRHAAERYCRASIDRGLTGGVPRILAVVGPAGFGKTTILGALYDHLVRTQTTWVGLIRSADLVYESLLPADRLSAALGTALTSSPTPIEQLVRRLTDEHGRGVVLLDTLDLILSDQLVPHLRSVLRGMTDAGATLVVSCRDFEFDAYLGPSDNRLAGLGSVLDPYRIPEFSSQEVEKAALAYVQRGRTGVPSQQDLRFAKALVDLAADDRSLREITHNPLLLGLLCQLFGPEGRVPRDLTVSMLYNEYWMKKVQYARVGGATSNLAIAKNALALRIARRLFEASPTAIREELDDGDILDGDIFSEGDGLLGRARDDLVSEGVLERVQPEGRLRFFHQTLLEYAIARWLTTVEGGSAQADLIERARAPARGQSRLHWWPVVRQVAALIEAGSLEGFAAELNPRRLDAFRALALGICSRRDASYLQQLLPIALGEGEPYQDVLLQAAEMAPRTSHQTARAILHALILNGSTRVASLAAQAIGPLLRRSSEDLAERLEGALSAIDERVKDHPRMRRDEDPVTTMQGWVVEACVPALEEADDPAVLAVLRGRYFRLGARSRQAVISLHRREAVPLPVVFDLLSIMVTRPLPKKLQPATTNLIARLLRESPSDTPQTRAIAAWWAQRGSLPIGWIAALEAAAGRVGAQQPAMVADLTARALTGSAGAADQVVVPVLEAIKAGTSSQIVSAMLGTDPATIPPSRLGVVSEILEGLRDMLDPVQADELVAWIRDAALHSPAHLAAGVGALARHTASAFSLLEAMLVSVPSDKRPRYIINVVRVLQGQVPPALLATLERLLPGHLADSTAQVALVELLAARGALDDNVRSRLIGIALARPEGPARVASRYIAEYAGEAGGPAVGDLLSLMRSRTIGVRANALRGLGNLLGRGESIPEADALALFAILEHEEAGEVIQAFGDVDVAVAWIRRGGATSSTIAIPLASLAAGWLLGEQHNAGVRRTGAKILRALAESEHSALREQLEDWAARMVREVDARTIRDGEKQMINLLAAIGRTNPAFFRRLVDHGEQVRPSNWRAILAAVRRIEGPGSSMLDMVAEASWAAPDTVALVLEFRGA